jgi:hypothetical protein
MGGRGRVHEPEGRVWEQAGDGRVNVVLIAPSQDQNRPWRAIKG